MPAPESSGPGVFAWLGARRTCGSGLGGVEMCRACGRVSAFELLSGLFSTRPTSSQDADDGREAGDVRPQRARTLSRPPLSSLNLQPPPQAPPRTSWADLEEKGIDMAGPDDDEPAQEPQPGACAVQDGRALRADLRPARG
mmetsp:Transcript_24088/g.72009  ORF Transcript_24088/g.72009 Transcript_24088/m.72009 type:complete len:141 (-) Transcript_24088:128-550(-)